MDQPLPNTYWVVPGRLLAGEHPTGGDDAETRRRLESLQAAGVDYFIDLTERGEVEDYRTLLPRHSQYLRMAIPDMQTPQHAGEMQTLQMRIRNALVRGRRIYIHCRAGIGRTGLVIGCYLAEESGNGSAALANLNRLWRQCARSDSWPEIPQTAEQADYIRDWPKHREAARRAAQAKRGGGDRR